MLSKVCGAALVLAMSVTALAAPRPGTFDAYVDKTARQTGMKEEDVRADAIARLRNEHQFSTQDLERVGRGSPELDLRVELSMVEALEKSDTQAVRTALEAVRDPRIAAAAGKAFEAPVEKISYTFHFSVGGFWKGQARKYLDRKKFLAPKTFEISYLDTSSFLSGDFDVKLQGPAVEVRKWLISFWRNWAGDRTSDNFMEYDKGRRSVEADIKKFDEKYPAAATEPFLSLWPI